MLKIWKKSYQKDGALHVGSLRVADEPGASSSSRSPMQSQTPRERTPPIVSQSSTPGLNSSSSSLAGNRRSIEDADTSLQEPPPKRIKREHCEEPIVEFDAGSRLPDINEGIPKLSDNGMNLTSWRDSNSDLEAWKHDLFLHLHDQNMAAVVYSKQVQRDICAASISSCSWSADGENKGHGSTIVVCEKLNSDINTLHDLISDRLSTSPLFTDEWQRMASDFSVAIITSITLQEALRRRILPLETVKMLIFLVAVDSRDKAILKQIMNTFYDTLPSKERPRILAIFSSHAHLVITPKSHTVQILRCTLFPPPAPGPHDEEILLPQKPLELAIFYDSQQPPPPSGLLFHLMHIDRHNILKKHLTTAEYLLKSLGPCASDRMWKKALKDIQNAPPISDNGDLEIMKQEIESVQADATNILRNHAFPVPNVDADTQNINVSQKFMKLVSILESYAPQGESFRGIIFVQKRALAISIVDLLESLNDRISFVRPFAIYGHGPFSKVDEQERVFADFASGAINVLVATKSLEEMELPLATCIIRFDLLDSLISYANTRTHAAKRESHLILMAERGNDMQRRVLATFAKLDRRMEKWIDSLPGLESTPPPRSLRESIDPYRSDSDDENDPSDFIQDPTTGGRLYPTDAISVIYRVVANLDVNLEKQSMKPLFKFTETSTMCICTILVPTIPPLPPKEFSGSLCPTKALARRTACYELCEDMFRRGILDYRLFPRSPLPKQQEQLAEQLVLPEDESHQHKNPSGSQIYKRKKPEFWRNSLSINSGMLYPTVIFIEANTKISGPYHPLVLLTHGPLPPIRSFNVYLAAGSADVRLTPLEPFGCDARGIVTLEQYTLRLLRIMSNRQLLCSGKDMVWFLAPLKTNGHQSVNFNSRISVPNDSDCVNWEMMSSALTHWVVPLRHNTIAELESAIQDCVLQDRPGEFTRRYEAVRVRPDLNPLSKTGDREETFLDQARHRRKGFEGARDLKQPLVQVRPIPPVLNHLSPQLKVEEPDSTSIKCLIPELCFSLTIPASVLRTAFLVPSITKRLNDTLLVKELNGRLFEHKLVESDLLSAITLPSAGMDFDYERLELLGDAFLKYLSSVYLFVMHPMESEGVMHLLRQKLISNRSLLGNAVLSGLPAYAQSRSFIPKGWLPPNYTVAIYTNDKGRADCDATVDYLEPGQLEEAECDGGDLVGNSDSPVSSRLGGPSAGESASREPYSRRRRRNRSDNPLVQHLNDKALADITEAIIGAAYLSGGRENALWTVKRLNIPVTGIDRWSDFNLKPLPPPPQTVLAFSEDSLQAVEKIIGRKFAKPFLLVQALTHSTSSFRSTQIACYERLEFIGDAILDFLAVRHIFDAHKGASPGELTTLKSAMVSNSVLAAICVHADLHKHLIYDSDALKDGIDSYAKEVQRRQELQKQGKAPTQYWTDIEPPKALSDVVESILGALYISDGFQPTGVETVYDGLLKPFYQKYINSDTLTQHPTKVLFELLQSHGCQMFEITRRNDEDNPGFIKSEVVYHDIVLASASDSTPQSATRQCSLLALDALDGDPGFLDACDCRSRAEARRLSRRARKDTVGEAPGIT